MQLFKGTITIPSSGTTSLTSLVPANEPVKANVSVTPTSFTATFIAAPYSDHYTCTAGSPTNIPGILLTGFSISGTVGDTVSLAIYYPEMIQAPLVAVTATIPNTVKTDFGQSGVPAGIETAVVTSASVVATIGGTPMAIGSIQDPPQQNVATGKGIPVKSEA